MIHTDGIPTIANAGSLPSDRKARAKRMQQAARDIAAAHAIGLDEARRRLNQTAMGRAEFRRPLLDDLAETLISEEPGLD